VSRDCTPLVLNHEAFEDLIKNSFIKSVVHPSVAGTMAEIRYKILDLRYSEDYGDQYIPGAILMPLYELRNRMDELDNNQRYIVYCHAGGCSAFATLIQNQFDVVSLEGGIGDWPFETTSVEETAGETHKQAIKAN
jgi:rhodanese-related sulfurtransferase